MVVTLTPLEEKAYNLIKKAGNKGILQSELWRKLGINSKEGSRITLRLVKKGIVYREPVIHEGRRTYRLFIAKKLEEEIDISGFIDIPCFTCTEYVRCSEGGYLSPSTCPKLSLWLMDEARKVKEEHTL